MADDAAQGFLRRHWLGTAGVAAGILIPALWLYLQLVVWKRHGDDLMLTTGGILVTLLLWFLLVVGIARYWKNGSAEEKSLSSTPRESLQPSPQRPSSFPSLSALNAQVPNITFPAHEWFRISYYSPLTAEVENNIKIAAEQNQPADREGFLARLIGVGVVSYMHDMTWAYIFKSQLLMLAELNRRNGILPLSEAKTYYDKAVVECPKVYENYSFEQWIDYVRNEQLLIRHPTDMLEITHRGKDLLRYLAHWGRDASAKAC